VRRGGEVPSPQINNKKSTYLGTLYHSSHPNNININIRMQNHMAAPAEPILASNIWSSLHNVPSENIERPAKRTKISSGATAIDNALDGGFDIGSVNCITSEPNHGANDFVHGLLVTHLLSAPNASATVIDSTHSFDLRRLYKTIEASSQNRQEALNILDRLKIMKIFDYVGLAEALSELRESMEERATPPNPALKAPKATIPDSQEDEEEAALHSPSPVQDHPPEEIESPSLLIIDSISHVFAPLIKNNYAQGQALLASLMRSLNHLTRMQSLCTLVLSTALTNKPNADQETLSIFRSCTIRPVLGHGLGYLLDLHLYLHRLPRRSADPHSSYHSKSTEMVSVLEVVQDRYAGRFGRWAPFVCSEEDGRLVNIS
jgi:RecA/RadA recombinase